jgi:hypothetical protein
MLTSTLCIFLGMICQSAITDADFWPNAAVVYAEVLSVDRIVDGQPVRLTKEERLKSELKQRYVVNLKPIATLTGNCDAALQKEIAAETWIGRYSLHPSAILKPPADGTKVIVLVERLDSGS